MVAEVATGKVGRTRAFDRRRRARPEPSGRSARRTWLRSDGSK